MARRKKQNEEESKENQDNIKHDADDDTFGLPEVEYEPLKRDEPEPIQEEPVAERPYEAQEERVESYHEEEPVQEEHPYRSAYSYMEEDKQPVWPKVLGFILIFLVAAAVVYYFAVYQPNQRKEQVEKARQEQLAREKARRAEEARMAEELRRQEAEQRRADSLANLSRTGTMETLTGRTGRYYVVVASAIDVDLLTDFGNKLVKKGSNVMIIPPFGKTKFHRLAIDVKDTYADAQATADGMKGGDFGDQIWVVRY